MPSGRIELSTPSLQDQCSTTELRRPKKNVLQLRFKHLFSGYNENKKIQQSVVSIYGPLGYGPSTLPLRHSAHYFGEISFHKYNSTKRWHSRKKGLSPLGGLEPPAFRFLSFQQLVISVTAERASQLRHRGSVEKQLYNYIICWLILKQMFFFNANLWSISQKPYLRILMSVQIPIWSSGQDTWLSPRRLGFDSRYGKLRFGRTTMRCFSLIFAHTYPQKSEPFLFASFTFAI